MSKYIEFNFPATRFVRENTGGDQLDHVMSEVEEVREAVLDPEQPFGRIVEEMVDLYHSIETYFRIINRVRGDEYLESIFDRVEAKNTERGYYEVKA